MKINYFLICCGGLVTILSTLQLWTQWKWQRIQSIAPSVTFTHSCRMQLKPTNLLSKLLQLGPSKERLSLEQQCRHCRIAYDFLLRVTNCSQDQKTIRIYRFSDVSQPTLDSLRYLHHLASTRMGPIGRCPGTWTSSVVSHSNMQ